MRRSPSTNDLTRLMGENLARWRVVRGMSQRDLGQALAESVSSQQISKFEAGKNSFSGPQLVAFAHALDIPVTAITHGAGDFLPRDQLSLGSHRDTAMMKAYKTMPVPMQTAFAAMVSAIATEMLNNKRSIPNG